MGTKRIEKGMTVIETPDHGDTIDARDTMYPTLLHVVGEEGFEEKEGLATTYGYVLGGEAEITLGDVVARVRKGAFFCAPGMLRIVGTETFINAAGKIEHTRVVCIKRYGFRGMQQVGQIEKRGRLSYIDGCSDSLLVYPPRLGDPCFNHLHFPPGIKQTQHTHPSVRMGIVASGKGKAFRVPSKGNTGWEIDLAEGCVFLLPEQEQHSFRTDETDTIMNVIAYHPDSDWGPTDAAHPMRNRTYIGNDRTGQGE